MDKYINDNSIDCCFNSPPYNNNVSNKWFGGNSIAYSDNKTEDEYKKFINDVYSLATKKLKPTGHLFINIKSRIKNGVVHPPFWLLDLPFTKKIKLKGIIIWVLTGSFDPAKNRYFNNYEYIFHFTKTDDYYFNELDQSSIWNLGHTMSKEERTCHVAAFPIRVPEKAILASTKPNDLVFDPFSGSGSTAIAAKKNGRNYIGFEILEEFHKLGLERLEKVKQIEPKNTLGRWVKSTTTV